MDHRQGRRRLAVPTEAAGDRADGREDFRAGLPEQVAESRAIGMSHGIDATVIHRMLLLEVGQDHVEEAHITSAFARDGRLPARHAPFLVDERRDGRKPLREDQDRSLIDLGVTPASGGVRGAAAVAVPAEDHGQRARHSARHAHQGRALHAVDVPGLLDAALRRLGHEEFADFALSRQRSGGQDGEQDEEETAHK